MLTRGKLIICVIFSLLLVLVSCTKLEQQADVNTDETQPGLTEEATVEETHASSPATITFSSMEQIQYFVEAVNGTKEQYEAYVQQYGSEMIDDLPISDLIEVADRISGHIYPFVKEGISIQGFGATYTLERDDLDIVFITQNVHVCFSYKYALTETYQYDSEPLLENLSIYNTTMNLYDGGRYPVGSVMIDTVPVLFVVYSEDVSPDLLNDFEFREIGS